MFPSHAVREKSSMNECVNDVASHLVHMREPLLLQETFEPKAMRAMLNQAWSALACYRGEELLIATQVLEPLLDYPHVFEDERASAEIQTLLAVGYIWKDNVDRASALAHCALERQGSARFHSVLLTVLRYAYWRSHRFSSFYGFSSARFHRNHPLIALAHVSHLSMEAAAEVEQLRLKLAERLAKQAIELAHRTATSESNASLLSTCVLASLAYEIGATEEADLLCQGKAASIEQHGTPDSALWGFTVFAKISIAKSVDNVALWTLQKGVALGVERGWPRLIERCASEAVVVHLARGRCGPARNALAQAKRLIAAIDGASSTTVDSWDLEVAGCRIALEEGEWDSAMKGFTRLRESARRTERMASAVRLTALLAACLFRAGKVVEAVDELRDALQIGAEAGLYRTFVDELPLLDTCLRHLRQSRPQRLRHLAPYIDSILAAKAGALTQRRRLQGRRSASKILSTKETVILRLISVGLSNKCIARELHIAPETVKSHAKRIFLKLATRTRAEAVARAGELGILK